MMRIGKGLTLIVIVTFLCQNIGFCLPEESSTLRLPVNGSPRVKKAIEMKSKGSQFASNERLVGKANGLVEALLDKWLRDFKFDFSRPDDLIEARRVVFEKVRDLAYDISPSIRHKDTLVGFESLVGDECSGSCIFKHYLLAKMLEKLGVPKKQIRYVTVPFKWHELGINYPRRLMTLAQDIKDITIYHVALEVNFERTGEKWVKLDATWGLPLKQHGFKVNTYWDGVSATDLGVIKAKNKRVTRHAAIEERDEYFTSKIRSLSKKDNTKLKRFYNSLDLWLEEIKGYERIREFLKGYFPDGIDEKAVHSVSVALSRGIIDFKTIGMALDSWKKAGSLPVAVDSDFIFHIVMWLEIINQKYFVPVITGRHRLDKIIDTLTRNPYVDLNKEGATMLDVGTGYLPKITKMLAKRFRECKVFGTDIVFAGYLVKDLHGTSAVFDQDENLVALHSDNAMRLHRMIVDFESTRKRFLDLFKRLKIKLPRDKFYYKDRTQGEIFSDPVMEIKKHHPNLQFKLNKARGFDMSFIGERFDVIWIWNVLIHFGRKTRKKALSELKKSLKRKGIIIEGYASPSGNTAIYAIWQENKGNLVMREFVFTSPNLKYPLWNMRDKGYLVGLLSKFVSLIRSDEELRERLEPKYPQISSSISARQLLLEIIRAKIEQAGYIVELNRQNHLVIKFTGKDKGRIKLSSLDRDMDTFLKEQRSSKSSERKSLTSNASAVALQKRAVLKDLKTNRKEVNSSL